MRNTSRNTGLGRYLSDLADPHDSVSRVASRNCASPDSNRDGLPHRNLNPARLPVPPLALCTTLIISPTQPTASTAGYAPGAYPRHPDDLDAAVSPLDQGQGPMSSPFEFFGASVRSHT